MNSNEFSYLLPYLFSLALSLGVFAYSLRHRHVRGVKSYTWFIGGQALTILGFILELVSPNLQTKILWDKFQWLTDFYLVTIPFLLFSIEFSEHKPRNPVLLVSLVGSFLAVFTLLLFTDELHHLFYPNPHLGTELPFPELKYDFTYLAIFAVVVYGYSANLYGLSLLLKRALEPNNPYRMQFLVVSIGLIIPIAASVFPLLGIRITPQRDPTPFAFAVGNVIVAWGLSHYRLFDIAPIARERIIENMSDPVIVIDPYNRVVDVNNAAISLIGKQSAEVIGHHFKDALDRWPVIAEMLEDPNQQRREISAKSGGELYSFDLGISPILNQRNEILGRIVVARDITRHKNLEMNYRMLSEELEQRVQERTGELQASAERYRAVVQNQTEFIVRWKPDRTRTFVNEAYCRYFGFTYEQAMQTDFMTLIAEEDRPAVEAKIERLLSGETRAETEIHRVPRPNGSIGWQEWTDHAILDPNGTVVEFQSVGRDITQRKQAEDALRTSEERFSKAFQASPIIVVIARIKDAELLEVNETFEKITGFTRAEAIGRSTFELGIWVEEADRENLITRILRDGQIRNVELPFRIRSGSIITCLLAADLIELDGERCLLATIQDISERKLSEEHILRLNRLYVTISQINQTIVHARDKQSLFSQICQVTTEHGQFRMAWIGVINATDALVHPLVFAGEEQGYLDNLHINYQDVLEGRGPTGTAIREGRCVICQDIANDPRMAPWRENALQRGYRSSAAVPLREDGCVIGALTVYAGEMHAFDDEDEALLDQIGQDVSFALDSLKADSKREIAEAKLADAYDTTLEGWAKALELRDKETEGHSRRVTKATLVVARAMGFDEEALLHVRRGSILHDIGKMGIPDEILRKRGPLNLAERAIVEKHPVIAYDLLKSISFLEKALEIPYRHHEKWDGSGYPFGLKGEEIPLSARIFAVVDVWDALSSDRSYRSAWEQERVMEYLLNDSGKHFDPKVVEVFLQLLREGKI